MIFNSIKNCQSTVIGVALLIVTTVASPVQAITFVTDRTALSSNDQVDWSSLGKVFNPFSPNLAAFLPNSFSAQSSLGLSVNVNIPQIQSPEITPPFVFQTSFPPNGIPTNFSNNDFLLFTGFAPGPDPAIGNPGPITITFAQPVLGAGTQIAVDDTPQFTAFISAFDNANNLLGTFSTPGTSSLALDNSAVFLGVLNDTPNISE
ncbi:hypothetical protein [Iningainema tapete]|uniref:PEP-CTERM sorting domain-containing protein n=1 Tax=Iningainema tapete BLCC-T55 TaxID=2748662 RepID=A0A8J6XJ46_9CYAN|nr:hypothetical protein [Iningainema tapete]MBD2777830.1 hypothetical protein [Iningainema tapete BLCC-T55]